VISKQLLLNHFTGCSPNITVYNLATSKEERYATKTQCLFTVGSVIKMARKNDHLWGTGMNPYWQHRNESEPFTISIQLHVHATRGPRTWNLFEQYEPSTINEANISIVRDQIVNNANQAFGDPGFLTSTMYPQYATKRSSSEPKTHYCIIPHYQDLSLPQITELKVASLFENNDTVIHIISPRDSWENVLEQISTLCHYVASSSLHGLILSESIGIPTMWFQIPDQKTSITEGNFKYKDYYDSIGISNIEPVPNMSYDILTNTKLYKPSLSNEMRQKYTNTMIQSFPYYLFESFCH
jgi:Polysaccharide pyruvyl transferase